MGDHADNAVAYFMRKIGGKSKNHLPTVVTCRICGETNLRWGTKKGGFWEIRNIDGTKHIHKECI